jgi:osmotically inducible protein OsmC
MKKIYSTSVTSTGGRNGHIKSTDSALDVDVKLPGSGDKPYLNPETLFAGGYAACFNSALMSIIGMEKITAAAPIVTAEVDLLSDENNKYKLGVKLTVEIEGLDRTRAEELVNKAHQVCPYSNATRGNIDVILMVK